MAEDASSVAIKVVGAISGCVYVTSLSASVGSLRQEVARLLNLDESKGVKMIVAGKTLQDDSLPLSEYKVTAASRVLVTKGAEASQTVNQGSEKQARLDKMKSVLETLAGRDSRGATADYAFSLENQDGSQIDLAPEDQKAIVMGLTLHQRGKKSTQEGNFDSAMGELLLAEEAFAMCDTKITTAIDNVGMLLLDIVWACYKLGDKGRLAVAKDRLAKARVALTRAHGPNLERVRSVMGRFRPELAIYVRLEALEGVVAHYNQEQEGALRSLHSAQEKLNQLKVSDDQLGVLLDMGYDLVESRRALRFSGGDMTAALDFIKKQRTQQKDRRKEKKKEKAWLTEREQYGKSDKKHEFAELRAVEALQEMGYQRGLAAEALRQAENNASEALEHLMDVTKRPALELAMALTQTAVRMGEDEAGPSGSASEPQDTLVAEAVAIAASLAAAISSADIASSSAQPKTKKPKGHHRNASDDEIERELIEGARGSAEDAMAAYDLDLSEEQEVVTLFMALCTS